MRITRSLTHRRIHSITKRRLRRRLNRPRRSGLSVAISWGLTALLMAIIHGTVLFIARYYTG